MVLISFVLSLELYIYIYSWKLGWSRSRYMGWSRTRTGHASIRAWSFNSWLTSQFFVLLMLLMLLSFYRWLSKYTIHWQFMNFEILWFLWTSTIVSFLKEMLLVIAPPPAPSPTPKHLPLSINMIHCARRSTPPLYKNFLLFFMLFLLC